MRVMQVIRNVCGNVPRRNCRFDKKKRGTNRRNESINAVKSPIKISTSPKENNYACHSKNKHTKSKP